MRRKEAETRRLIQRRMHAELERTALDVRHHDNLPSRPGGAFRSLLTPPDGSSAEHAVPFCCNLTLNSRKPRRPTVSGRDSILPVSADDTRRSPECRLKMDTWSVRRRRFEPPSSSVSW